MLYLGILLCFVFFAGVAMTVAEGLWNNAVLLLVIILAGLLAFTGGVPLGSFVAEKADAGSDYVWHVVFACVWGVFALSATIMRMLLERTSQTRVKFLPPLEMVAGPLVGLFAAAMFTSFVAYTIITIPVTSGEWATADAAGWVKSLFQYACIPFHNVLKPFATTEGLGAAFFVLRAS